ncbi:MAG: Zn-ribbon domain-containing OB-fold protein [Chloroflexota bacterium]|nr:Zn-ribbon domain-containing OB-fold protein [Chloroflexota bacterium]
MEVARFWRTTGQRYQLVGEVCPHCHNKIFPPRDVCPTCEQEAKTPFVFSGKGEVYSYSTIHAAPQGFEKYVPYTVALVRLNEGPLVTAQLTDVHAEEVKIGMPVEMVTRVLREDGDRGMLVYGYKFRPSCSHEKADPALSHSSPEYAPVRSQAPAPHQDVTDLPVPAV